jgi:hypothetical protein
LAVVALASAAATGTVSVSQAASLPDGRAYELVSPAEKGTGVINPNAKLSVSPDGESAAFTAEMPLQGSTSGPDNAIIREARTGAGWERQFDLIPQPTMTVPDIWSPNANFLSDMDSAVVESAMPLTADTLPVPATINRTLVSNLYLWRIGQPLQLLTTVQPSGVELEELGAGALGPGYFPVVVGASADGSRIFFDAAGSLGDGAPGPSVAGVNLYEWRSGSIRLVGDLPDGTPAEGSAIGSRNTTTAGNGQVFGYGVRGAVSTDGSRVYFNAPVAPGQLSITGQLYLREGESPSIEVSESQATNPDPHGGPFPATFEFATPDGGEVYFTSNGSLVDDANTGTSRLTAARSFRANLYRYDVATGRLVDLTPTTNPVNATIGAGVGHVVAASEDGSVVYFVAKGVLDEAEDGILNAFNLYVFREGRIELVASAPSATSGLPEPSNYRVTPDGVHLLISTSAKLTSYDNVDAGGTAHTEVYLYTLGSASGTTICLSCAASPPTETAPLGETARIGNGALAEVQLGFEPVSITDDGRQAFFESNESLAPAMGDNGQFKVYEWHDGVVSGISTGSSGTGDQFKGATADGSDVFFTTREKLVTADQDNATDIYDARVGGGFPESTATAECGAGSCRDTPGPPPVSTPGSSGVVGHAGVMASSCKSLKVKARKARQRVKAAKKQLARSHSPAARKRLRRARKAATRLNRRVRSCTNEPNSKSSREAVKTRTRIAHRRGVTARLHSRAGSRTNKGGSK